MAAWPRALSPSARSTGATRRRKALNAHSINSASVETAAFAGCAAMVAAGQGVWLGGTLKDCSCKGPTTVVDAGRSRTSGSRASQSCRPNCLWAAQAEVRKQQRGGRGELSSQRQGAARSVVSAVAHAVPPTEGRAARAKPRRTSGLATSRQCAWPGGAPTPKLTTTLSRCWMGSRSESDRPAVIRRVAGAGRIRSRCADRDARQRQRPCALRRA